MDHRQLSIFAKVSFLVSVASWLAVFSTMQKLPPDTDIVGVIRDSAPVQTEISPTPFDAKLGNYKYTFVPKYSYDIYGVVVSVFNKAKNDPADVKDVCLVWGDNIIKNIFAELKYGNDQEGCHIEEDQNWQNDQSIFKLSQYSNNNLLTLDKSIASIITGIRIGDELHIQGRLVDYSVFDKNGILAATRNTSISNQKADNGDSEIILVSSVDILKKWNRGSYYLMEVFLFIAVISLVFVVIEPFLEKKREN